MNESFTDSEQEWAQYRSSLISRFYGCGSDYDQWPEDREPFMETTYVEAAILGLNLVNMLKKDKHTSTNMNGIDTLTLWKNISEDNG